MMLPKGRQHPSGRPIRLRVVKTSRTIWRIPDTESNVPRLRPVEKDLELIGFVHFPLDDKDDE